MLQEADIVQDWINEGIEKGSGKDLNPILFAHPVLVLKGKPYKNFAKQLDLPFISG